MLLWYLMSLGYAEKLSYRSDLGGQLGAPELFEEPAELIDKIQQLSAWVRPRYSKRSTELMLSYSESVLLSDCLL